MEVEGEAAEVPSGDVDIVVLLRIVWCGGGGAVLSGGASVGVGASVVVGTAGVGGGGVSSVAVCRVCVLFAPYAKSFAEPFEAWL